MEHTKIGKKGGILISLDFNKAFESLEWPLITKVLDSFKMGDSILFQRRRSTVTNNGFATNWFKLSKGVHEAGLSSFHVSVYIVCGNVVK